MKFYGADTHQTTSRHALMLAFQVSLCVRFAVDVTGQADVSGWQADEGEARALFSGVLCSPLRGRPSAFRPLPAEVARHSPAAHAPGDRHRQSVRSAEQGRSRWLAVGNPTDLIATAPPTTGGR